MAKLSELQTKYATATKKAEDMLEAREKSGQEFTEEQKTEFKALIAEKEQLKSDISIEQDAEDIRKQKALDKAGKDTPEKKIAKQFSFFRAVKDIASGGKVTGVEAEMKEETERELRAVGQSFSGNVGVPSFMLNIKGVTKGNIQNSNIIGQQRDLTAAGAATGDELVEDLHIGHVYGLNVAPKVISVLGATVLPGLTSDVHLTKTGIATSVWATEVAASTETTPSTARITMTPKRLTGYTEISKTLLTQVPQFVEGWIRKELQDSTNVALDAAAINGSGSAGQPTGILNFGTGVNIKTLSGQAMGRADLIDMETLIADDNADMETLKFLTTNGMRGYFKQLATDAGSGLFVWTDGNMLVGYDAYASTNVPSNLGGGTNYHAVILGVWSQLLIAQFGGLDLLVDPFSLSLTNMIRMVINTNWDINTRHLQAFAYCKDTLPQ